MESLYWLWDSAVSTGEKIKKKSIELRDWMYANKGRSVIIVGGTLSFVYFVLMLYRRTYQDSNANLQKGLNGHKTEKYASQPPQSRNLFKTRMQTFFRNTQKGCDNTVISLMTSIRDKLEVYVEIPSAEQLRTAHKTSNEEKIQLWDQVKIGTFTRTVSSIYAVCLSVLFLRTEVNILGRYLYMDASLPPSEQSEQEQINQETQKKYLAFYEYFLNTGLKELCDTIRPHVAEELIVWPLTRKLTLEEVLIIFANIRSRVEGITFPTTRSPLHQFLLPPEEAQRETADNQLACLLNETRDVLEGEQFDQVLKTCLEAAYTMLADQLKDAFVSSNGTAPTSSSDSNSPLAEPIHLPMPKVLPLIKTRCKNMLEVAPQQDSKSSLVQVLFSLPYLEDFSSNIFTSSAEDEDL